MTADKTLNPQHPKTLNGRGSSADRRRLHRRCTFARWRGWWGPIWIWRLCLGSRTRTARDASRQPWSSPSSAPRSARLSHLYHCTPSPSNLHPLPEVFIPPPEVRSPPPR
eukprot:4968950-Pyramimonas_sp.AAC.1